MNQSSHGDMNHQYIVVELEQHGLGHVLQLALERYKRDQTLGRLAKPLKPADALALERLLGKPTKILDLKMLDTALRKSKYGVSLLELLEFLNAAPIVSAKSERQRLEQAFLQTLETVADLEWRGLLSLGLAGASRIKRAIREHQAVNLEIVSRALLALRQTPERLPSLATRVAGEAHALDVSTLAGQILLEAVDALDLEPPVRDGVSSSVLLANLLGFNCVHLPWREVIGKACQKTDVWLLENPAVFEALLDAGTKYPMLCSSGQPSAACIALLDKLGGKIFFAADFDLGGLRIAKRIFERYPQRFTPWHFDAATYRIALENSGGFVLSANLEPFKATFPALVQAMEQTGRGAHQEAILELFCDTTATKSQLDATASRSGL